MLTCKLSEEVESRVDHWEKQFISIRRFSESFNDNTIIKLVISKNDLKCGVLNKNSPLPVDCYKGENTGYGISDSQIATNHWYRSYMLSLPTSGLYNYEQRWWDRKM